MQRLIGLLAFVALPLNAQSASARALGALGPAEVWQCVVNTSSNRAPVPTPPGFFMTFVLLEPSARSPVDTSQRMPFRTVIVGFSPEGELLTYGEIVLDSTATPRVQMPNLRREPSGEYTGTWVGGSSGREQLSPDEIAAGVAIGRELWRRRCTGPRA